MNAGTKPDAEGAGDTRGSVHGGMRSDAHEGPDLALLLQEEIGRVAEAYRRMPHSKFARRLEPFGTRAQAGRWLTEQFVTLTQRIEAWPENVRTYRRVPTLGDFALGDQIAVTGRDLVEAYRALEDPGDTLLVMAHSLVPVEKAMAAVLESTTALRKEL